MDRIDEWMNRAFQQDANEPSAKPEPSSSSTANPQSPVGPKEQEVKMVKDYFHKQSAVGGHKTRSPKDRRDHFPHKKSGTHGSQKNQQPQQRPGPKPQRPHGRRPQGNQPHGQPHGQKPLNIKKEVPKMLRTSKPKPAEIRQGQLKIIPLGGLNEVGKNMMALEYEDDIIIIDMGLEFPSEDMFGIDYVIPDITYLEDNKKRIRGIVLTHAHLDHIGGIPYMIPKLDFPPLYGTKLTMGLVEKRIAEFKQERMVKLITINPEEPLKLGKFLCNFFRVAHSIPDAVGVVIDTPVGKIVHTGDFKFDDTPARNQLPADMHKMQELGKQNVLALFCESTNALKPGHSMSEMEVGKILEETVQKAKGRVIVATFSSQIGRIQQILDAAERSKRQVFVSGRSMRENIEISARLGYLLFPKNILQDIRQYKKIPDEQALILTTGSQGEAVSALARIASGDHPQIKVKKGDTIILSSSPIVGNERAIFTIINQLSLLGANVIHNQIMDVHSSGHGKQDELCKMIDFVKPKYLIPIHGEYYMRQGLSTIAQQRCGFTDDRVIMLQNGDVLIAQPDKVRKSDEKIETKYILIDGRGEGHIDSQVQTDREILSMNGALIVLIYISGKTRNLNRNPDVVSRGFIYMHETEEITQEIGQLAQEAYRTIMKKNPGAARKDIKRYIQQTVDKYTTGKLERRPLIIPLLVEV